MFQIFTQLIGETVVGGADTDGKLALGELSWFDCCYLFHTYTDTNVILVLKNKHNLQLESEEIAIRELAHVKEAGGCTVVEATTHGIGRNPLAARVVSKATGLNIVVGAGF